MNKIISLTLLIFAAFMIWFVIAVSPTDDVGINGRLIRINGKIYKIENRISNSYVLEPIKDTAIIK